MLVCHHCDNRACVNPEHLFLGNHQDNMRDMVRKGRQCRGSENNHSKLKEDQVRRIRSMSRLGQREIADMFGITQSNVSLILSGKTWRHLA